ncbi:hypothetical protein [Actinacidiphila glaucinigra]|uniref:Uncharacterized protein n=1 Tax=Actinacidiphila glaucinigra TaxID=235986 RepID=A0A239LVF1_9ACTN|nr:hypothetical protein [Actinacidiphila glaucinigra]SNT33594.1 hypothetical protein SAMN05216252_12155 [Actinacidiphila glaucinigra]
MPAALLVEVYQHGEGAVEPLPWILIRAADVDPEQVWQLADAIATARHLPITVVLPATPATRQAFPHKREGDGHERHHVGRR